MAIIGIIAGTNTDTKFGLDYFGKFHDVIGYPISKNPQDQTKLQALGRVELTIKVQLAIYKLAEKGATTIIIYCNSLSGAIDLKKLRENNRQRIITPLDIYEKASCKFSVFGVLAANCQSTANIEKLILGRNKDAVIIGVGNLNIVNDIEQGLRSTDIIMKHRLAELCGIISGSGAEIIILGCTHYSIFYDELRNLVRHKLLEPSGEMLRLLE